MSRVRIAAIVEGHGEVEAVPMLIRRIAAEIDPSTVPDIPHPIRVPSDRLKKEGELERTVDLAIRKLGGRGAVFILIDCDWDDGCPKWDAPALLRRAENVRRNVPVALVLAYKEYEAWFIAAAVSLGGKRGLTQPLEVVDNPEDIRGAKEWLSRHMSGTGRYVETLDQPALTELFDMQEARRANSFDKCYREVGRLLAILGPGDLK